LTKQRERGKDGASARWCWRKLATYKRTGVCSLRLGGSCRLPCCTPQSMRLARISMTPATWRVSSTLHPALPAALLADRPTPNVRYADPLRVFLARHASEPGAQLASVRVYAIDQ